MFRPVQRHVHLGRGPAAIGCSVDLTSVPSEVSPRESCAVAATVAEVSASAAAEGLGGRGRVAAVRGTGDGEICRRSRGSGRSWPRRAVSTAVTWTSSVARLSYDGALQPRGGALRSLVRRAARRGVAVRAPGGGEPVSDRRKGRARAARPARRALRIGRGLRRPSRRTSLALNVRRGDRIGRAVTSAATADRRAVWTTSPLAV